MVKKKRVQKRLETERRTQGFGLAYFKAEGAPIHPDDTDAVLTKEQYERQLKAYNEWHKDKEE